MLFFASAPGINQIQGLRTLWRPRFKPAVLASRSVLWLAKNRAVAFRCQRARALGRNRAGSGVPLFTSCFPSFNRRHIRWGFPTSQRLFCAFEYRLLGQGKASFLWVCKGDLQETLFSGCNELLPAHVLCESFVGREWTGLHGSTSIAHCFAGNRCFAVRLAGPSTMGHGIGRRVAIPAHPSVKANQTIGYRRKCRAKQKRKERLLTVLLVMLLLKKQQY